jgi:membrane protein implicated in regulation of membrane protease activity
MRDLTRFVQLAILAVILFVTLLASWAVAVHHTPLAWFAAVTAWLLFLWLAALVGVDAVQDAQLKDAQLKREMQAAGYVFIEGRWWAWTDEDGDGEIDEGELVPGEPHIRVMGKDGTPDDLASQEAYRTRLRSLLLWCYRRQEECRGQRLPAGQIYGQGPGRVAFPGTYDEDMHALQRAGFIRGRSTGHVGKLVIPGAAEALEKFDAL